MGLVIFGVMALYLIVSIIVVTVAVRAAKKRGKTPWHWGVGAALVMYLIPFWDWIPTVVAHKYYCSTEAGFWVYKTVDQWKAENPGASGAHQSLKGTSATQVGDGVAIQTYVLNERVVWKHQISHVFLNVRRYEDTINDANLKSVLAKKVYFEAGKCSGAPKSISDLKFWLNQCECKTEDISVGSAQGLSWKSVYKQFQEIGGEK